jgi:hypothetical protein
MSNLKLRRACCIALAAGSAVASFTPSALASSHREAPYITSMPKVDATDFYMFQSSATTTTLIANYIPLQDPYGGPNYFSMDPNALYEIHVDNNGDAQEDLTFQFRFKYENKNAALMVGGKSVAIPLVINGSGDINSVNSAAANVRETYSVSMVRGDRRKNANMALSIGTFDKPLDNIGNKSIANYAAYAQKHIHTATVPNCSAPAKIFVGQRKDPFVVNLGETFDLVNIKAPAVELMQGAESAEIDSLRDKNVTTIALEIPTACLTNGTEKVIGGWTTASVRQGRLVNPNPDNGNASKEGGAWTQVSRLGMPLVNEVVIGLKDKDRFNASQPKADGQFADYVTNPTLPALLEILFKNATGGAVVAPTNFPRTDLVAAFLTGINGLNQPANVKAAEMLRLNTGIAPTTMNPSRLGVLGGDLAGFPNGRRIGDDVVDISLRVAMGVVCHSALNTAAGCKPEDAPAGTLQFTDGAYIDHTATYTDAVFPFAKTPLPGSPAN